MNPKMQVHRNIADWSIQERAALEMLYYVPEKQEFDELWLILKGQDHEEFKKTYDSLSDEEKMTNKQWETWFDGSGVKHWWD